MLRKFFLLPLVAVATVVSLTAIVHAAPAATSTSNVNPCTPALNLLGGGVGPGGPTGVTLDTAYGPAGCKHRARVIWVAHMSGSSGTRVAWQSDPEDVTLSADAPNDFQTTWDYAGLPDGYYIIYIVVTSPDGKDVYALDTLFSRFVSNASTSR